MQNLFKRKKKSHFISIREASALLGVSIDTVRRWDKKGIVSSVRKNGKDRYFDLQKLTEVKDNLPLTISQAASVLHISVSTLRRLEKAKKIHPQRGVRGKRLYTHFVLDQYKSSLKEKTKKPFFPSFQVAMRYTVLGMSLGVVSLGVFRGIILNTVFFPKQPPSIVTVAPVATHSFLKPEVFAPFDTSHGLFVSGQ